ESAMSVLGEAGVIRDFILEPEPTEPAIGQVEVDFLTQPPLGAYPKAVAHQQHPDHELRVHRWTARVTVEGLELASQLAEIEEAVNPAQQVIRRNMLIEVERVEESVLIAALCTHHQEVLLNTVLDT